MPGKEPLYPHIPKSRNISPPVLGHPPDIRLRFLPDSYETFTQTVNNTGLRARLESVFHAAIARAKGVKSW